MQLSTWQLVVQASPFVKLIIVFLVVFSILTWAIIVYKCILFRSAERRPDAYLASLGGKDYREALEAYLPFLATTGTSAPFIGLLGTVWGIMDAFRGIGASGSASLAVVSPAIAEALIATAAGLMAAIPAVMAYNAFLHWSGRLAVQLDAAGATRRRGG